MNTKRIAKWVIVLFLLAALPVMTVALAQDQQPDGQQPAPAERGESIAVFPWANTETEPNNISGAADDWCGGDYTTCGGVNGGIISTANDVDYWEVYVPGLYYYDDDEEEFTSRDSFPILIDIEAQSIGSPLDPSICLYSDDGFELACSNNTDTVDPLLYYNFEVTNGDTARRYYLAVRAHNGSGAGANAKYQLLVSTPYLFSASSAKLGKASVEGIPFQAGDILAFSKYQGGHKWVMLFDLSDLGVKGNVSNLSSGWRNSDHLLVGFAANATLPGIARPVTPWEVVVFNPTQLGPTTAGTFQLWWDGRGQGLTLAAERLDAIDWPKWAGMTRLYASTVGNAKVYGGPGPVLVLPDEDIGLWSDGPAAQSYPRWARFFDSSVANHAIGDVIAFSYTAHSYNWSGSSDDWEQSDSGWDMVVQGSGFSQKDVITSEDYCYYTDWLEETVCGWRTRTIWHGPDYGWAYNLDAIQVQMTMWGMQ